MFETELDEYRIDGPDLNAMPTTGVADLGRFDVVVSIRLQESERGEPLDQLGTCLWPGKTLQQLLQNQPGRKNLVGSIERVLKRLHFRHNCVRVTPEREGPDAGVDEQAHGLRARSAL